MSRRELDFTLGATAAIFPALSFHFTAAPCFRAPPTERFRFGAGSRRWGHDTAPLAYAVTPPQREICARLLCFFWAMISRFFDRGAATDILLCRLMMHFDGASRVVPIYLPAHRLALGVQVL